MSHCVNLWNGNIDSQALAGGCELGKGEKLGEEGGGTVWGMAEHDHASPRETPSMAVREAGQMGARPVMSRFHRTGRTTIGCDAACVEGCDNK